MSIDWSWFNSAQHEADAENNVNNAMADLTVTFKSLENLNPDISRLSSEVDTILYSMIGKKITGTVVSDVTIEEWYNIWLTSNTFAFDINFIMNKVLTSQTSDFVNTLADMRTISEYIINKLFSTPIPSPYPNSGNKPRLVESGDSNYTTMVGAVYDFFWNNGLGMFGMGNELFTTMCGNFTIENMRNSNIKRWCGCFSPNSALTNEAIAQFGDTSGSYSKACDPLCISQASIKLYDPSLLPTLHAIPKFA